MILKKNKKKMKRKEKKKVWHLVMSLPGPWLL